MILTVLQILLVIAVVVLCYYLVRWVLGLLGVEVPDRILVVIMVILGLMAAIAVLTGQVNRINWWGP